MKRFEGGAIKIVQNNDKSKIYMGKFPNAANKFETWKATTE